jgi:hypothetical protein
MSVDTAHTIRASSAAVVIVTTMKNVIIIAPQHTREGQLAAMSKSLARTNKSQGPGQCDSARQQVGSVAVGTLAPGKRLFLNVRCRCLLGTLRGKKL